MTDINETTKVNDTIEYSIPYILVQIKQIQENTAYLQDAMQSIFNLPMEGQVSDHVLSPGVAKAQALANIVQYRETTNQQLLRLYEKIYEDLRGEKAVPKHEYYQRIVSALAGKVHPDAMVDALDFVNQFFKLEK